MYKKQNDPDLKVEMAFHVHLWVLKQIENKVEKVDKINTSSISSIKQKLIWNRNNRHCKELIEL